MKQLVVNKNLFKTLKLVFAILSVSCLVISCATLDPQKVDVELPETVPAQKITQYFNALDDMGLMTEIYDIRELKVQSMDIDDKTGANATTGREIPKEITEIVKSTLNSIGGRVTYIPYDPTFIKEQATTGYVDGDGIMKFVHPEIILSGGITEFDRGLETRGGNTDFSGQKNISAIPEWVQGSNVGVQYGGNEKSGLARITLDFNLLNFETMTGIPKMTTTNSMEVGKALKGKELAVSIFGLSFGRKGTIKKVQGRHEAVRLLVEFSMIQIVGKQASLPYWRLLGDDAIEDRIVTRKLEKFFYSLSEYDKIQLAQEYLFLHGYDLMANGQMDSSTISALQQFDSNFNTGTNEIAFETFKNLYMSIPLNVETLARRGMITNYYAQLEQYELEAAAVQQQQYEQQQQEAVVENSSAVDQSYQEEGQVQENVVEVAALVEEEVQVPSPAPRKKPSIGRILAEDEW